MKKKFLVVTSALAFCGCASEFDIASSDVPQAVMTAFQDKYSGAQEEEWEVEKEDGKLVFEVEFKFGGKRKEASFRPDGAFVEEE